MQNYVKKWVRQDELAKAVSVSSQAVSKWENGGVPDTDLLPGISDFFGISIDTLFGRNITDYNDIEKALGQKIVDSKLTKNLRLLLNFAG